MDNQIYAELVQQFNINFQDYSRVQKESFMFENYENVGLYSVCEIDTMEQQMP